MLVIDCSIRVFRFFLLQAVTNNNGGMAPLLQMVQMLQQTFRKKLVILSAS